MYVLVREDLPPGLQLAQAVHASVEFALANPERAKSTPTVVVLGIPDEDTLLEWGDVCWKARDRFVLFHEPDLGEHTALAVVDDGERFASLSLAGYAMT